MLKPVTVTIDVEGRHDTITMDLASHAEAMQSQFTDTPESELDELAVGEFIAEISHWIQQEAKVS